MHDLPAASCRRAVVLSYYKVQEGSASLRAFSAAQNVELSYNEE